jgi:amino-acid N-acetyltransferase
MYKKPTLKDVVQMQELVKSEVETGTILYRSDDDVSTNIRSYTIAICNEKTIGYAALHIHSKHLAEVRSLIVDNSFRGKGVGKEIVKQLLNEAKSLDVKEVFTLTYQASFFEKLGFKQINKELLPSHKIWADCINCKHFPICDEISLIISL